MQRYFIFLFIITCFLQNPSGRNITGYIFDATSGVPLPYTKITDQRQKQIGNSDSNGYFTLSNNKSKISTMTFSHIGYKHQTVLLKNQRQDSTLYVFLQDESETLQNIEITASPLRQILTQSYSMTVIDSSVIEDKIASSLIDALEQVPGITKKSEYHSAIALRGLGGKRLLITKDRNRRMGNFSDGFMGQGVNIYNLAKVEVIKGPASVKYGPGAITGIINLESKSPFLQPGLHGKFLSSYGINNHERNLLAGINWAGLNQAAQASLRYRNADDYVCGKGVATENSGYRDKDFHVAFSTENNHSLCVTTESELHMGGPWGRPIGFNGTRYMRVYNPKDNTWHNAIYLVWKPEQTLQKIEASLYYDKEIRNQVRDSYDAGSGKLSYSEKVKYDNWYSGWRGLAILKTGKRTELNLGTDGVIFRINSPTEQVDYFLSTTIRNRVTQNTGVALAGIFAEMESQSLNGHWKFRAGIRGDYSRINEGEVHDTLQKSGRNSNVYSWNGTTSVVYNFRRNLFCSFQVARSCRMPDATEMFIVSSNTDGIVYGNPRLKPEHGLNLDAGIRGNLSAIYFDCSLFANFLNNFISLDYWNNSGKKGINYLYQNIDKARIFGAELSVGARWPHFLQPDNRLIYNGSLVITRGDKLSGIPGWLSNGIPLRNISPINTRQEIMLRRMLNSARSFYIGGDILYYATQNRIAPSSDGGYLSPSYTLFGASLGFTYRTGRNKWDLKIKGDNLADNRYRPFESIMFGMGRNTKLMVSVSF